MRSWRRRPCGIPWECDAIALHWKALFDDEGPVVRYVDDVREGTPIADLTEVVSGRRVNAAAVAVLAEPGLAGWLLSTNDAGLGASLVKRGATPKRHAYVMKCDLREHPAERVLGDDLTAAPLPVDAEDPAWAAILPSWRAAFPPDHPDHFAGDDAGAISFVMRLVDGSELGPLHRSTTLLYDDAGRAVAGMLVNIRPQDPPWGGAWIADIWRDPELRGTGIGPRLIDHAKRLLVEDGQAALSLAVTAGNPARHTYEATGFRVVVESHTLRLPDDPPPGRVP